jgi:hypothetical protein
VGHGILVFSKKFKFCEEKLGDFGVEKLKFGIELWWGDCDLC